MLALLMAAAVTAPETDYITRWTPPPETPVRYAVVLRSDDYSGYKAVTVSAGRVLNARERLDVSVSRGLNRFSGGSVAGFTFTRTLRPHRPR